MASILPYEELDLRKVKLAMKIGGEYKLGLVGARQWQKFAREMRVDAESLIERLAAMAARLPDAASAALTKARAEGLDTPIIDRLTERLIERAAVCGKSVAVS